jgi:hypothetical protein
MLIAITIFEWVQATFSPPPPGPPPVDGWDLGGLIALLALLVGAWAARGRLWAATVVAALTLPTGAVLLITLIRGTQLNGWAVWSAPIVAVALLVSGALCTWPVAVTILRPRDIPAC